MWIAPWLAKQHARAPALEVELRQQRHPRLLKAKLARRCQVVAQAKERGVALHQAASKLTHSRKHIFKHRHLELELLVPLATSIVTAATAAGGCSRFG